MTLYITNKCKDNQNIRKDSVLLDLTGYFKVHSQKFPE